MTMTIPQCFIALSDALQPTTSGLSGAQLHINSIRTRLDSSFDLRKFFLIGSASRDTSIRGSSDIDLLAVLSRDEAKHGDNYVSSSTFLRNIRTDLKARYPATEVRKDGQAIVLHFAKGDDPVDVVPAIFHQFRNKHPVYWIPDGGGGWLETAPEVHGRYLQLANQNSGGKLRKLTQFIKHWKNQRTNSAALSSIYIELLMASNNIAVGPKSYALCLYEVFSLLLENECRGFQDPVGVAGILRACQTKPQWASLVDAVSYAHDHAGRAIIAESKGNVREASRQWGIVFNGMFPEA